MRKVVWGAGRRPRERGKRGIRGLGLVLVLVLGMAGCIPANRSQPADAYSADVPVAWAELSLDLVRETPGFSPPVASRAFGYLGVALYETVQPGMAGNQSLAGQLNEFQGAPQVERVEPYHWPIAANAALASLTRKLFPTAGEENLAAIDALEEALDEQYRGEVNVVTYLRSVSWGRSVADAVFAWSLTDGGHEGYLTNFSDSYIPPEGPGMWVSTPPQYNGAMQPDWGNIRPFVLTGGNECPAAAPPTYSEEPGSDFYTEAYEVYEVGQALTPEQNEIAVFWADDPGKTSTPPGHWVSILSQVLVEEEATLGAAAEAYAKLGVAVADAFITCWYTKYDYNLVRPITYIQDVIDPTWNTPEVTDPVFTPPFPEYTSGHSVQSGAAATVLTDLFGPNYAFTDYTHERMELGPRTYDSFMEAAQEAAISRLYGGIHYRAAIEVGVEQGQCVGERVLDLQFTE